MARDDGGAAFAAATAHMLQTGMNLRAWFAGQALGLLANSSNATLREVIGTGPREEQQANAAEWCFDMADAMLAEREKRRGG